MSRKLLVLVLILFLTQSCRFTPNTVAASPMVMPTMTSALETPSGTKNPCPINYTEFTTPHLTLVAGESRALMVTDDEKIITVLLDKTNLSTANFKPDPGHETVLEYVYNNTTYKNTVGNFDGILCYTDITISSSQIDQFDGFRSFEQNTVTMLDEFVGLNVMLAVSNDNTTVAVIIEGRALVAQVLKPAPGQQMEIEFNIGFEKYTVIVINDEGQIKYRVVPVSYPSGQNI